MAGTDNLHNMIKYNGVLEVELFLKKTNGLANWLAGPSNSKVQCTSFYALFT